MKKFFSPKPVIITTGGGGPGLFHDTIRNMKNALSLGSDAIRTNVSITKDNKIVLFSNAVFQNRDLAARGIGSYTRDGLRELFRTEAGSDALDDIKGLFPEMEETLSALNNCRFNLNLSEKDPKLIQQYCDIIRNLDAGDRILTSSLNAYNLKKVRNNFDGTATAFSFGGVVAFYALYRSGILHFKKKFSDDALIIHEMIGASFLANAGLIGEARARGIHVYVLNIMTEDQVKRLFEAGADGFVTNYASMVKRSLPASGEKNDS
ncbi:MAG TPA: glycerophosphodiester phosphodiesterase family protein [Spirochaetota bacterium]|nr:glycerophosphodiester phosphodiesterase family protein [Spirochaetota bacterium]HPC42766.1 glycerophosphodiester phosphodiesterase family protein [Spirochaetota bacterium]HPL17378.1 glycerophosphodiester phosphodiesterase family protein [Spirochaetota bacterium]HQF07599.1 glycerophosphodiester phosphodiesterase family protein [Spirochaetota bacterium]HQH96330.1 glycerophosphodiester phosphodiesterase family protein [Spirochaetota bacterium]